MPHPQPTMKTKPMSRSIPARLRQGLLLPILLISGLCSPGARAGTPEVGGFTETPYATEMGKITGLAWATDGSNTLFVTVQGQGTGGGTGADTGLLRVIKDGVLQSAPVASLPVFYQAECGLDGICIAPNYATTKHVYLFATINDTTQKIYQYTIGTSGSDLVASNKVPIGPDLPTRGGHHNGGGMAIDSDGSLYFAVGNQAGSNGSTIGVGADGAADEWTSLGSKIGRMTPLGAAVTSNPWYNPADGITAKDYIWAKGLRNPFGLRIHPEKGTLWLTEVGDKYEQIFLVTAGSTQGFSNQYPPSEIIPPPGENNTSTTNGKLIPKLAYRTGTSKNGDPDYPGDYGACITRGAFYPANGTAFPPAYQGDFFFVDYYGRIVDCDMNKDADTITNNDADTIITDSRLFLTGGNTLVDITVGPDGALYYASINQGTVFRLSYDAAAQSLLVSPTALTITEGSTGTYTVKPGIAPASNVVVNVARTAGSTTITNSPASLTFTPANWNTPQTITVTAADDANTVDDAAAFTLTSSGLPSVKVLVTAKDNDTVSGAPTVAFSSPNVGAQVSGTTYEWFSGTGYVSDPQGVATIDRVEYYVDGVLKSTDYNNSDPTWHTHYNDAHGSWNTTTLTNGAHTLLMKVIDSGGLSGSSQIEVTVTNGIPTLLDDPFTDGGLTNGADPLDTNWAVLAGSPVALGVGQFAATGNTTNALVYNASGIFAQAKGGGFASQALNVGGSIVLSQDFRLTSTSIPSSVKALRFGLGSSSNTYDFWLGCGTIPGAQFMEHPVDTVNGVINTALTTTGTPTAINDNLPHTFDMRLTRTATNTLTLLVSIDGVHSFTATRTGVTNFTFDRVLMGTGDVVLDFNVDNGGVVVAKYTSLISDPFTDGGGANGADPLDTNWAVLAGSSVALGVGQFAATGNTGNALVYTASGIFAQAKGGTFASQALNVGDSVVLAQDFRLTQASIPSSIKALRFGLGSSSNTYDFWLGCGTIPGAQFLEHPVDTVNGVINTALTTTGTPLAINDNLPHIFDLTLTRTATNTLALMVSIDGIHTFTATRTGVTNFTFDRVLMGTGDVILNFNVDNVDGTVESAP